MDQRPNVSINNSNKPSRLLALFALIIAFSLPFVLVKSFPHKQKTINENDNHLILPAAELPDPHVRLSAGKNENTLKYVNPIRKAATGTTQANLKPRPTQIVQPNKTIKPAVAVAIAKPPQENEWTIIKTRDKDSLATIFNRAGLSAQILQAILRDNPHTSALTKIKPDQEIQFQIKKHALQKMILPFTSTQYLVVSYENGHYRSKINSRKMNSHNHFITATVQGSLYNTAKRLKVPPKLIQQMTEIFTWDIDFAKDVRAGDRFTIIYKAFYIEDKLVGTGDILAVSYTNRGKTFQAVQHTSRTGQSDYYTPQGMSLKKAFTRYPIRFSHISSSFSMGRYHPILHYMRAHKGVDLAARIGTPIMATGSGRIEMIGRQNGYGNMIKIKHDGKYSTIYGHMLKFQKGLSKGDYVKRGQIIGYVGQTGLASGPHCHYEFHINGQPKNPTTVDLPRGLAIAGREMNTFKANTNTLLAQLKLYESGRMAASSVKKGKANA